MPGKTYLEVMMMVNLLKSSFFLRFAGGFVAGVLGVIALQPAEAVQPLAAPQQIAAIR
jgi:hypothetical protein